jgi:3-hydroxy-3-methylglutaryl CoA synthase
MNDHQPKRSDYTTLFSIDEVPFHVPVAKCVLSDLHHLMYRERVQQMSLRLEQHSGLGLAISAT